MLHGYWYSVANQVRERTCFLWVKNWSEFASTVWGRRLLNPNNFDIKKKCFLLHCLHLVRITANINSIANNVSDPNQ